MATVLADLVAGNGENASGVVGRSKTGTESAAPHFGHFVVLPAALSSTWNPL